MIQWVKKTFSIIPNKKLGRQDFSKVGFGDNTSLIGTLPFEGLRNQITIMNSNAELNKILLSFDFHNDDARLAKNSLTMLEQLFRNKASGSLFSLLVDKNYVHQIEVDENALLKSCFRLFTIEIELTETGLLAWKDVIAFVFEYFRKVRDDWLVNNEPLTLFEEYRTMS